MIIEIAQAIIIIFSFTQAMVEGFVFPNEIWALILNINYDRFCIECAHQLPWHYHSESYKRNGPYMRESILGHLLLGKDVNSSKRLGGVTYTPLMCACSCKRVDVSVVQFLIDNGANVNAFDVDGWTPLIIACQDHPSVVRLLIENGANVNDVDFDGMTALMYACLYQLHVVQLLIENGVNVNAIDGGWTALHYLCADQVPMRTMPRLEW